MALGELRDRLTRALAPGEREFFDLLERAARDATHAAGLLDELVHYFPRHPELAAELSACRHAADLTADALSERLGSTYLTPIDRDQLGELAVVLHAAVAAEEGIGDRLGRYRVQHIRPQATRLASLLLAGARAAEDATRRLRTGDETAAAVQELRRVRRDGVVVVREGLGELFSEGPGAIELVGWKDLFERFEAALELCGRLAATLSAIGP